ncbi:MAG: replicative DNA helicase [Lentisphaeria bacterium]
MFDPTPASAPTPRRTAGALVLSGDRPLPHDLRAEGAVLGCMLIDPTAADTAGNLLAPDSFFQPAHQELFRTIKELTGGKVKMALDMVTLTAALDKAGVLERIGGVPYLTQLMNSVPSAANVEEYSHIVRDHAVLRRLIETGMRITDRCFEPREEVNEILDSLEKEVLELSMHQGRTDFVHVSQCIKKAVEHMEKLSSQDADSRGLQTGFTDLDKLITGLKPGDMIVLAARPSIGKTAFALNIVANVALGKSRAPVGVFSLEMSTESLVLRLLCSLAQISLGDIRDRAISTARWAELLRAAGQLKEAPIYIDDSGDLDVLELRTKGRRMVREHGVKFLVIDYLQLLKAVGGNRNTTRENEVSQMSGRIKGLAKELGVPIMVLAQLNRQAEQPGQRPRLSHLRESGAIEQDADIVAMLHRDRELETTKGSIGEGTDAELIIAKHRNGPTGIVPLTFLSQYTRFADRSPVADADVPA